MRPADRFDRSLTHPLAPWIGGVLLGLLISMRSTNALLAGAAVVACLLAGGRRYAARVAAGTVAGVVVVLLASLIGLGTANPYLAERTSFNAELGYPISPDHAAAARFDERPATHHAKVEISKLTLWSAYYFFTGRHSGLLVYFPLALVLVYCLLRRPDRVGLALLAGVAALSLFYLVYMPQNYFGGATFLGNRYFLVAYPALVLALRRLPPPSLLVAAMAVSLLAGGSAVASVRLTRGLDATSQSHTAAGLFRLLPYESTAREIEGQKGRFWSRDYVRFLDGFADVQRRRFILHESRPATQIMIATRLPRERFAFLVRAGKRPAALEWEDWRSGSRLVLEDEVRRRGGLVRLRPATPWRSHPFAFRNDETYRVYVLELSIDSMVESQGDDPEPVEAEVYYLGDSKLLRTPSREVLSVGLPERAVAGGRRVVRLRVRNTGQAAWEPDGVLPVLAGVRIRRPGGTAEVQRFDLPDLVPPGGTVDLELPVRFPDEPGRYQVEVDLLLHPVFWFSERLGEPLVSRQIEVVAPDEAAVSP